MKIIIKIGESQLPLQVKDEYEKELCFEAQKIINDKLLAYSRVYYTTEETVLYFGFDSDYPQRICVHFLVL